MMPITRNGTNGWVSTCVIHFPGSKIGLCKACYIATIQFRTHCVPNLKRRKPLKTAVCG